MALHPDLQIFTTEDGSPTLCFHRADGYAEKMHHSGGALTESLYIYHHGLKKALDSGMPPHVISVGLGLAYNELITLAEFAVRGIGGCIWSFESMNYLQTRFQEWVRGETSDAGYADVLNDIAARIEQHFGVDHLRGRAENALATGRLQLRGSFPGDTHGLRGAGIVFYDAFSNKMSPELWEEKSLQEALEPLFAPHALLCTYAKTGAMKRVLKNLGFKMEDRPGFQGKRDSTLAVR